MKVRFPFVTRQGMAVALAVAEEVENNLAWGHPFGEVRQDVRPELLSISGNTFRFVGGVVVNVGLINKGGQHEDWLVPFVVVRYYRRDAAGSPQGDKVKEVWAHEKLLELKKKRWWHHPHILMEPIYPASVFLEEE